MTPHLNKVLSYLYRNDVAIELVDLLVDACLSASEFGVEGWKRLVISVAETHIHHAAPETVAQVLLRKAQLSRLYGVVDVRSRLPHLPNSKKASYVRGQMVLEEAQAQIDSGKPSCEVIRTLGQYCPSNLSALESGILNMAEFLTAKALRFDGDFEQASRLFLNCCRTTSIVSKKAITHYWDVECEKGNADEAIDSLYEEQFDLVKWQPIGPGDGRRLRLNLANAYLMKVLLTLYKFGDIDSVALGKAKFLFKELLKHTSQNRSMPQQLKFYSTLTGLGMVQLVASDNSAAWETWRKAGDVATACWKTPGFCAMIVLMAQSELAHRLSREDRYDLAYSARDLCSRVPRQHHFVGQGTVWVDLFQHWRYKWAV
jgi:hypothetical protein